MVLVYSNRINKNKIDLLQNSHNKVRVVVQRFKHNKAASLTGLLAELFSVCNKLARISLFTKHGKRKACMPTDWCPLYRPAKERPHNTYRKHEYKPPF